MLRRVRPGHGGHAQLQRFFPVQDIDDGDTSQMHHRFVSKALQPLVALLLEQLIKQDVRPCCLRRTYCTLARRHTSALNQAVTGPARRSGSLRGSHSGHIATSKCQLAGRLYDGVHT